MCRKPVVTASTCACVLDKHTGGVNIDATRMEYASHAMSGNLGLSVRSVGQGRFMKGMANVPHEEKGRYPTNVVMQHKPGCYVDGEMEVGSGKRRDFSLRKSTMLDPNNGWNQNQLDNNIKNAPSSRGVETIPRWVCEDGCPLEKQPDLIRFFKVTKEVSE